MQGVTAMRNASRACRRGRASPIGGEFDPPQGGAARMFLVWSEEAAMEPVRTGRTEPARRVALRRLGAMVGCIALSRVVGAAGGAYPQTLAALGYAVQRETDAHRRYVAFGGVALREQYRGIAYMFAAFAVSEGLHARNFAGLITQLGGEPVVAPTTIKPGTTKQNLIAAVDDEIDSIDHLYPHTLERVTPEGSAEAARFVRFAWASERQHRDLIQRIRRYSPLLFEKVAKAIDEKTGLYFVCQTCGSTLNRVPAPQCPVCGSPPERYRQVPIPS
jgi:rubrerythrin